MITDLTNLSNCVNTHYDKIINRIENLKNETINSLTEFSKELEVFGFNIQVSGLWFFITGDFTKIENTKSFSKFLKKYEKLLNAYFSICYSDTTVRSFRRHTDLSDKYIDKIKIGTVLKHYCI